MEASHTGLAVTLVQGLTGYPIPDDICVTPLKPSFSGSTVPL